MLVAILRTNLGAPDGGDVEHESAARLLIAHHDQAGPRIRIDEFQAR